MRLVALGPADAPRVQPLAARAFDDLAARQGRPSTASDPRPARHYTAQHAHLLQHGSGLGAVDDDGELRGVALWHERGGLWVLSLLVVAPQAQGTGVGSALLRAVLADAAPRRLLHSSRDPRAVRAYARAGFRLLPALEARGVAGLSAGPPLDDVDGGGSPFAVDLTQVRASGGRVLALRDGRCGLVVLHGTPDEQAVTVLEADDDQTAADLLRGALALVEGPAVVGPLAPQEHWAVDVLLDAGLELAPTGPVAVAGVAEPLAGPLPLTAVHV